MHKKMKFSIVNFFSKCAVFDGNKGKKKAKSPIQSEADLGLMQYPRWSSL